MADQPTCRWWNQPVILATMIVGALTALLIAAVTIVIATGKAAPTGLTTVIGTGIGSLATLLVNNRGDGKQ